MTNPPPLPEQMKTSYIVMGSLYNAKATGSTISCRCTKCLL